VKSHREPQRNESAAQRGAKATGITNKPAARESEEQAQVPPRGARKGQPPPPEFEQTDEEAESEAF
jgi:hypothetical protein